MYSLNTGVTMINAFLIQFISSYYQLEGVSANDVKKFIKELKALKRAIKEVPEDEELDL